MRYIVTTDTDIGICKTINQDSLCAMQADSRLGQTVMAVVCDGMGGLAKGELASATVVRAFHDWFINKLPYELAVLDMDVIAEKWVLMLRELNSRIKKHGRKLNADMGTTFTGMLIADDQYLIVHVGDSRVYRLGSKPEQLTEDHTFVAREVKRGTMTQEQAEVDPRRHILLQCVGASSIVEPQVLHGRMKQGTYLICSDGFRHRITDLEMMTAFNSDCLIDKDIMHAKTQQMIEAVKQRNEKDNISVILIKAE